MFAAARPDPDRIARIAFGGDWTSLDPDVLAGGDVLDVRVRMGMYRLLVERTNPDGTYGAHDELHPFWGYASQLAWQARSGRLGPAAPVIERDSWWGACNYALSVVPYVAAMQLDSDDVRAWRHAGELIRGGVADVKRRVAVPYALGLGLAFVARALARLLLGPESRLPGVLIPERYRARFRSLRFPNQKAISVLGWKPGVYAELVRGARS